MVAMIASLSAACAHFTTIYLSAPVRPAWQPRVRRSLSPPPSYSRHPRGTTRPITSPERLPIRAHALGPGPVLRPAGAPGVPAVIQDSDARAGPACELLIKLFQFQSRKHKNPGSFVLHPKNARDGMGSSPASGQFHPAAPAKLLAFLQLSGNAPS